MADYVALGSVHYADIWTNRVQGEDRRLFSKVKNVIIVIKGNVISVFILHVYYFIKLSTSV